MNRKWLAVLVCALAATLLSAFIQDRTMEVASYGAEGPLAERLQPRPVAGWPAPFVADDPGTSVILQLGVEDDFRPGPFLADWAFWYVVLSLAVRALRVFEQMTVPSNT